MRSKPYSVTRHTASLNAVYLAEHQDLVIRSHLFIVYETIISLVISGFLSSFNTMASTLCDTFTTHLPPGLPREPTIPAPQP